MLAYVKNAAAFWPLNRFVCWHGSRSAPRVALTFDDGPRRGTTERVAAILKEHGVRATFFLEGRWIDESPDLVRMLAGEGHEIGNHAYEHGLPDLCGQVRRCDALLRNLGVRAPWVRPPRGQVSPGEILRLAVRGYRLALWSFDTRDSMRHEGKWKAPIPDSREIRPGDVVLLHDDNPVCIGELPGLIAALRERDLLPVTLSELL